MVARPQADVPTNRSVRRCVTISEHPYSEVLSALREVGGCGASFVFARAVGSLWRATPQAGQRTSRAWLSLYGPSGCRQLQCHAAGFAFILFGWMFELNMTKRPFPSSEVLRRHVGSGPRPSSARSVARRAWSRGSSAR
jgi:hypothetical protein